MCIDDTTKKDSKMNEEESIDQNVFFICFIVFFWNYTIIINWCKLN